MIVAPPPQASPRHCTREGDIWQATVTTLRGSHFSAIGADSVAQWAEISSARWHDFADYWDRLTLDRFMGDGGTYRQRRYGQFETDAHGCLHQLPHAPYEQAKHINPLNGGIARIFDPLEPGFSQHTVLHGVLGFLIKLLNEVEGQVHAWNVKLHPYRILATTDMAGQPTPEGLHRDGVDYVVSMMVKRNNILGGESILTDVHREQLEHMTLKEPMQMLILNDAQTFHEATAVAPRIPNTPAYRDVLVIAFEKVRNGQQPVAL